MPIRLMQPMRVMQDPLMIPLPPTSMHRTMPLNPRITLPTPRHLMRVPRMIGRLLHASPAPRVRLHPTLPTTTTLKIHLPRMMKTSLILSHDITSHIVAVGVYVYECANPFLSKTVPLACVAMSICSILCNTSITH
jgi:hypothetical protein